ncbi:hypothetical protein N7474_002427 [Penicillium riverlandense]|uniref:uncharacterized protein n=1 Tax=Penicillium riverlandense TaxID=1903569 RepID=UPI0025486AF0|nr:uncharacterized protein N7474_002427 [Penicillium riverlandense]KAJ5825289.1 hypothetical protein N7474_002427 [Penicillium riverlandense]
MTLLLLEGESQYKNGSERDYCLFKCLRGIAHGAVQAAQAAFESDWRWRSPTERSTLLFACADALSSHKEELAEILCLENGKPCIDALQFDVTFLIGVFKYFASLVDKLPGEHYDQGPTCASVYYEPLGVCAGIVPFNWPPIHTGGKTAPALTAGNTLVLKPAEQAPLTLMRIVDIISEVLPKDVVQVVPGLGTAVPQARINHPLVKMVSFTGSSPAGAKVAEAAGKGIKPLVLEPGGKNAFVVFDDVDLDKVVPMALEGAFLNKGEACTASSRFLVQRRAYDEFCSRLAAAVRKVKCGNGMDPSAHVGPVVSKEQKERSELPADPNCRNGYFVPPTLITDVSRGHVLVKDEIFGPVATVTPFDTEEEAVSIVNESEYGLTCAIFSKDHETCLRVSRKVDVGMVFINNYYRNELGQPFGGTKSTGFGREHCIETLRSWAQPKVVKQPLGLGSLPGWRALKDVF